MGSGRDRRDFWSTSAFPCYAMDHPDYGQALSMGYFFDQYGRLLWTWFSSRSDRTGFRYLSLARDRLSRFVYDLFHFFIRGDSGRSEIEESISPLPVPQHDNGSLYGSFGVYYGWMACNSRDWLLTSLVF